MEIDPCSYLNLSNITVELISIVLIALFWMNLQNTSQEYEQYMFDEKSLLLSFLNLEVS